MIVRAALNVLALGCILTGKALISAGLRSKPTGWRQVVGVALRGEPSKFAVSCFGLKVPGAAQGAPDFHPRVVNQLARFLQGEPEARYGLRHSPWITRRFANEHVDLVAMRFASDGALAAVEPLLAPTNPEDLDGATCAKAHAAVVVAYNRTRHLPEDRRPMELLTELRVTTAGLAARYASRLLAAPCVSFETLPEGAGRFAPPGFPARRCLGFGFLTIVVRTDASAATADTWILAHHTGTDGAPLQELASRLERAWGAVPVEFPEPDSPATGARPCFLPGEREVYETTSFHDFFPLLALRKKLNARLGGEFGGEIPFGALFLWRLAQEPELAGLKASSTVDVAASADCERDVDLVVLRPAEFGTGDGGLVGYARAFNRLVGDCRARRSPVRRAAQTAALMPPILYRKLLERSPDAVSDTFGAVGLSVLRDARVFVAPLSDVGFPGGFIAVGGVGLPTASGRAVGAVSVKGDRGVAESYPAVIGRMLERCKDA